MQSLQELLPVAPCLILESMLDLAGSGLVNTWLTADTGVSVAASLSSVIPCTLSVSPTCHAGRGVCSTPHCMRHERACTSPSQLYTAPVGMHIHSHGLHQNTVVHQKLHYRLYALSEGHWWPFAWPYSLLRLLVQCTCRNDWSCVCIEQLSLTTSRTESWTGMPISD